METILKVKTIASDGSKTEQRFALSDISGYRPWKEDGEDNGITFVVLKGGKSFKCDFPAEKLDKIQGIDLKEL